MDTSLFRFRFNSVKPRLERPCYRSHGLGFSALDTAELNGTVYATDFSNNLYTINTATGAATLIAYSGIRPLVIQPTSATRRSLRLAESYT